MVSLPVTSALTFTLEVAEKSEHLIIKINSQGPKRVFYRDTLLSLTKGKEKDAVEFLIQARLKSLGISPKSAQAESAVFNEICLTRDDANVVLKSLASCGSLFWKGKRLFVDPFAKAALRYHLFFEEDGALKVEGSLLIGGKEKLVSGCELLFPGSPPWFICDGMLQFFQEKIDSKWLKLVFPHTALLRGDEQEKFRAQIEEGDLEGEIEIVWKNAPPSQYALEALPFLILKDRSGGFADLWFDYASRGKVAAHDSSMGWRNKELELTWEKDLQEAGFKPKLMSNSRYYCPLAYVTQSLTFLLEMGWKVFDLEERQLLKQSDFKLSLKEHGEEVLVQGKFCFGEITHTLQEALGPLKRREPFLTLSDNCIGLIDRGPVELLCGDLLSEEITLEGILVKKHHKGLLEPLLEHPAVEISEGRLKLNNQLQKTEIGTGFVGTLYPYQQEGMNWLSTHFSQGCSGLLADEMGLGKTVQVLAFLSTLIVPFQVLIVVPTSLLFNWKREIEKFLPEQAVYVHNGSERLKDLELLKQHSIILTSYAILRLDGAFLQGLSYTGVILDEAQQIKNPDSQTARQVFQLKSSFRLAITGTPIENRWEELWSLFHFLMPELLGPRQTFLAQITAVPSKVKKSLKPFILRRRKEEVAKDLPPKINQQIWIDMSSEQKILYDDWVGRQRLGLLQKIAADGAKSHRMEILEAILRLRQIACHPLLVDPDFQGESGKLERLMEDLEEAVQEKRKVLIYSQFTQMLSLMEQRARQKGWSYVRLDGSTTDRESPVQKFQEDPELLLFFISLKAGGVGLNLTAADTVILYDPWWNDAQEEQAIDRAHRLGRSSAVIARRYVTVGTIEEKMLSLKKHKSALAHSLLEHEPEAAEPALDELYALLSLS